MDVSIIIVNYNTKKLLADCLASIYEQTKDIDFLRVYKNSLFNKESGIRTYVVLFERKSTGNRNILF